MPVLNEAEHLEAAVRSILAQDYSGPKEVVLALGPSTDGTDAVAERLRDRESRLHLVANPATDIPVGLNLALAEATGEVIVRVDAHAELPADYTARMVEVLTRTGAANAGGVMLARGRAPVQQAIARAYNSPLGLGGGVYHGAGTEGPAESAYLGVFRRAALEDVGGWDPTLRRAEDYDLNQRLIAAGHLVWFVPDVEVVYWPRTSLAALARQMWATGAWRGELVRRTRTSGVRYLVPPALALGLTASAGAAVAEWAGAGRWVRLAHVAPASYAVFLGAASVRLGGEDARDRLLNAVVLGTMHTAWAAGFLKGVASGAGDTVDRSRISVDPG
jgi:hypothetical protein